MAASPSLIPFDQRVIVGVADMAVSNNPNVVFTTYSLGSCLGISVHDPVARVGGLLHLMLPDSTIDPAKGIANPAMFVDTAVPALLRAAYQLKAERSRLKVCVAGGAQILDDNNFFNIGRRNHEALLRTLERNGLTIHASAVGGQVNRTMMLRVSDGSVTLRISGSKDEVPLCRS
jgi:chemotaxis protein CheD